MVNGSSLTQETDELAEVAPGLVKSVGCIFCWKRHWKPFTRSCGKPNPALIAA